MTKTPYGWPMMADGFLGLVHILLAEKNVIQVFESETGVQLSKLANRSPIQEQIDQSTGFEEETVGAFLDWVVINHWGEEGKVDDK
jgi:hypothetical protein